MSVKQQCIEETPRFSVSNSSVTWVKRMLPEKAQEEDEKVRDYIRRLVGEAWGSKGVEDYWEEDPDYGKQKNTVVPVQIGHVFKGLSYAIVREADNGPIIITIISEKKRQEALLDRWSPLPFEPKRTRNSSTESINKPFEQLANKEIILKKPEYIVSFMRNEKEEVAFVGSGRPFQDPIKCISNLLENGIALSSITVWEKKQVKVEFKVNVEGL